MSVHVLHPSGEFHMNLQYKLKADLKNKQRDSQQDRRLNVTGITRPSAPKHPITGTDRDVIKEDLLCFVVCCILVCS